MKFFISTAILLANMNVFAGEAKITGLDDVIAPVTAGEIDATNRQVGQIFYDTTAGAFKGVNKNGSIDTLSALGGATVTSGGSSERIERVTINSSYSIVRQSGSWVSSVTDEAGTGKFTVNFAANTFSAVPTCNCTIGDASNSGVCTQDLGLTPSTTQLRFQVLTDGGSAYDPARIDIICMGAR